MIIIGRKLQAELHKQLSQRQDTDVIAGVPVRCTGYMSSNLLLFLAIAQIGLAVIIPDTWNARTETKLIAYVNVKLYQCLELLIYAAIGEMCFKTNT